MIDSAAIAAIKSHLQAIHELLAGLPCAEDTKPPRRDSIGQQDQKSIIADSRAEYYWRKQ